MSQIDLPLLCLEIFGVAFFCCFCDVFFVEHVVFLWCSHKLYVTFFLQNVVSVHRNFKGWTTALEHVLTYFNTRAIRSHETLRKKSKKVRGRSEDTQPITTRLSMKS